MPEPGLICSPLRFLRKAADGTARGPRVWRSLLLHGPCRDCCVVVAGTWRDCCVVVAGTCRDCCVVAGSL